MTGVQTCALPIFQVSTLAAGAWFSRHELAAVCLLPSSERPDVVVFLDGINDLTHGVDQTPMEDRANEYRRNMLIARDTLLHRGVRRVIFAPQPFLGTKRHKSKFEQGIMVLPPVTRRSLREYQELIRFTRELAEVPGASLLDCTRVFEIGRAHV